jgi:excisionase family DNA binding protein
VEGSVTAARRRPGLDQAAEGERRCTTGRSDPTPAALGGSNRLLTVAEVADYLGVPKKTVYGCWRQWGLTACKVGRHLRFRERHVQEWLRSREA